MFNFWKSKDNSQQIIGELTKRIETLETVDKEYLGDQESSGNEVFMRITKDGSLDIKTKSFKFLDMPKETAMVLRDFLVKNFPLEPSLVSEINVSKDSINIKAKSIHIQGDTVFSGTEVTI